ncbi:Alpha/Beta hydrolase protein [Dactylonectria macrodidyma]|uniref:Alpha/Beta hydrolase protein n=1 Tax=Dactylonectria macrodidyma TaxID=307937 RepID=A0A9P9IWT4_9HYPO|nr:Alpha/Beta hydrolase protein [Dactylonectria macrodidyma]
MQTPNRQFIRHPNGQTTAYLHDTFVDPWRPAETILIQHGFGRTAEHFYHWVPALARRYNVIRRELRGHGGSSVPKPGQNDAYDYSADTIIDEIKDTLDQLGIERVHFVGESTSGMLAEIFAATYPGRVHSVIVCSSPTHLPLAAQQFLAFGKSSWPAACRELGSRGWAEQLATASGTVSSSDSAYLEWWMDRVAVSDGEGLASYAEFLGGLDSRPYIGRIRAPMLVLCPTNSAMVTIESMQELAAQVPRAQLQMIEAKGHEIYAEAEDQCLAKVLEFLSGL